MLLSGGGDGSAMVRCISSGEGGKALGEAGTGPGLPPLAPFFANVNLMDASGADDTVTGVCASFDDKYLLTVGSRGGFFSLRLRYAELEKAAQQAADGRAKELAAKAAKAALVSTATVTAEMDASMDEVFGAVSSSVPGDFHDDSKEAKIKEAKEPEGNPEDLYSIEDAKLKTEEDNRRREAEIRKNEQRAKIADLRRRYEALVEENSRAIPGQQLTREEMQLDPKVAQRLIAEGDRKCEEVEKIMRFESEKKQLAVEKLQRMFLANVAVEGITMKTFRTNMKVRSFRVATLSDSLQESLRAVHALIDAEEDARKRAGKLQQLGKDKSGKKGGKGKDGNKGGKESKTDDSSGPKDERTQEARKELRAARKAELEEMMSRKPMQDEEDPDDVAAIEYTLKNMGDLKLKTAKDYVVPIDQRVNAEKKRRQMVLLEESVHAIKMGYNQRFLALRELKKRIIANIKSDNVRIRDIDKELDYIEEKNGDAKDAEEGAGAGGGEAKDQTKNTPAVRNKNLWEPEVDPKEWPEDRFKVTEEELRAAAIEKGYTIPGLTDVTAEQLAAKARAGDANAGAAATVAPSADATPALGEIDQIPQLKAAARLHRGWTLEGGVDPEAQEEEDSPMEVALREERRIVLTYERKVLLDKTNQTVEAFDEAMYDLCREKLKLDCDLKTAEMRMLTFLQELEMLKEFEKKDKSLTAKLEKCKVEKGTIVTEISECHTKLEAKRAEIEVWQEKDKVIESEFANLVPESNALWPQLFKIFKRKIKRSKKGGGGGGEDGDSDDSNYESSDYESSDDGDSDDDDDDDDSCPAGCDQALYDKVLELREKRLDQEDILADFQKNIDDLKKQHDRMASRERQINKELVATEKDIELFQTEKQQKLNTLDVYVTLQLSQILNLVKRDEWFASQKGKDGNKGSPPASPMGRGSPMRRTMSDTASVMSSTAGADFASQPEYILPPTLDDCVLISSESIDRLRKRIVEIREETLVQEKKFRNLHKEKKKLYREKKTRKAFIDKQEKKCNDLQMLKFGQTIDLESLDKMGSRQVREEEAEDETSGVFLFCGSFFDLFPLTVCSHITLCNNFVFFFFLSSFSLTGS